jgi:hypothetical protein
MDDNVLLASVVVAILMLAVLGELLSSYAPALGMSLAFWQ